MDHGMGKAISGLRRRGLLAGTTAVLALPGVARAQAYPSRPIRIIVPWTPGGSTDTPTRLIAA